MFNKADIQVGDIVVDRRGVEALAVKVHERRGIVFLSDNGFMPLRAFTSELRTREDGVDSDFDIMKIYRYKSGWGFGFNATMKMVHQEGITTEDEVDIIYDRQRGSVVVVDGQQYRLGDLKKAITYTGLASIGTVEDDEEEF